MSLWQRRSFSRSGSRVSLLEPAKYHFPTQYSSGMFLFAKKLVERLEGGSYERSTSAEDNAYFKNTLEINNKGHGLRVTHVEPHSTAHQVGLESWFDYIVGINGHDLPMLHADPSYYSVNEDGTINYGGTDAENEASAIDYAALEEEFKGHIQAGEPISLRVWSAKGGVLRNVSLVLSWEQLADDRTLYFYDYLISAGLTVASRHLRTATYVWRILHTHPELPASVLQLVPHSDYVIGCDSAYPDDTEFTAMLARGGEALLSHSVLEYYNYHSAKHNTEQVPITFFVYNHEHDILRPVTVSLSRSWSKGQNKGLLGCDVGYGLLHRVPEVPGKYGENRSDPNSSTMFDADTRGTDLHLASKGHEQHASCDDKNDQLPAGAVPPAIDANTNAPPRTTGENTSTDAGLYVAGPPRTGVARKKKAHPNAQAAGGIADIMNEELARSQALDSPGRRTDAEALPLGPPPPARSN